MTTLSVAAPTGGSDQQRLTPGSGWTRPAVSIESFCTLAKILGGGSIACWTLPTIALEEQPNQSLGQISKRRLSFVAHTSLKGRGKLD